MNSFIMNKIFKINEEKGLFADVPQQPPAGKLQYYVEITDSNGIQSYFKENPIVIRFKGGVPAFISGSTYPFYVFCNAFFNPCRSDGSLVKFPLYKKYSIWTLILFIAGGMILGPIVQNYAFGDLLDRNSFWMGSN